MESKRNENVRCYRLSAIHFLEKLARLLVQTS